MRRCDRRSWPLQLALSVGLALAACAPMAAPAALAQPAAPAGAPVGSAAPAASGAPAAPAPPAVQAAPPVPTHLRMAYQRLAVDVGFYVAEGARLSDAGRHRPRNDLLRQRVGGHARARHGTA